MPADRRPRSPGRARTAVALPPGRNIALVAAGGAVGALARVAVGRAVPASPAGWPWGTLAANLTGALLLALLLRVLTDTLAGGAWARPLLGTGMLGAYTTFSTLSLETGQLALAHARPAVAVAYAVLTLGGGLVAAWAGTVLARLLLTARRSAR